MVRENINDNTNFLERNAVYVGHGGAYFRGIIGFEFKYLMYNSFLQMMIFKIFLCWYQLSQPWEGNFSENYQISQNLRISVLRKLKVTV